MILMASEKLQSKNVKYGPEQCSVGHYESQLVKTLDSSFVTIISLTVIL